MHDVFTWPVGYATTFRERPPFRPVAAYLVATAFAGAATGTVVAAAGYLLARAVGAAPIALACAAVTAYALAAQWRGRMGILPEPKRQVQRYWLLWRKPSRTAVAWGLQIGTGMATRVEYPVAFVVLSGAIWLHDLTAGAVVGLIYGGGRGSALVMTWFANRHGLDPDWEALLRNRILIARLLAVAGLVAVSLAVEAGSS